MNVSNLSMFNQLRYGIFMTNQSFVICQTSQTFFGNSVHLIQLSQLMVAQYSMRLYVIKLSFRILQHSLAQHHCLDQQQGAYCYCAVKYQRQNPRHQEMSRLLTPIVACTEATTSFYSWPLYQLSEERKCFLSYNDYAHSKRLSFNYHNASKGSLGINLVSWIFCNCRFMSLNQYVFIQSASFTGYQDITALTKPKSKIQMVKITC